MCDGNISVSTWMRFDFNLKEIVFHWCMKSIFQASRKTESKVYLGNYMVCGEDGGFHWGSVYLCPHKQCKHLDVEMRAGKQALTWLQSCKTLPIPRVIQRERERWKINENTFRIRSFITEALLCFELEWDTTGEQRLWWVFFCF